MNDGQLGPRTGYAARVDHLAPMIAALLWMSAGVAAAQDDPLGDIGDEPAAEEPSEESAPSDGGVADEPVEEAPIEGDGGLEEPLPEEPIIAPTETSDTNEVIVTGSRIRRSNFAQPAAVAIVDRKQLAASGAQNMTDVVKNMNINSGSDVNTSVSTGSAGSSQFNLRGLGVSSTLVLLNGRRLPLTSAVSEDGSSFVDINGVPLGIIERIEVLKGGASAIYGSDAVAGVVNILTRKRMDGFEAHVGAQATDNFDQHEWDVSLLGGAQGERTRVTAGLGYFKREPLMAEDRAFTQNGRNVSTLGWPSAFSRIGPDGRPMTMPLINRATGEPVLNPDMTPARALVSFQDPGCGVVPFSAPSQDPVRKVDLCTFNFNDYFMLMINEERANVYTSLEHDISDHTMAFIEATYARSRASRTLSPSYPLLVPLYVPADHQYNPTGDPLRWYGRVAGGNSPGYNTEYDSDTLHTVAGIGGDFGGISDSAADWEWEVAGTWSGNRYQTFAQDVLTANLQDGLNSCGAGSDPADCWNPFSTGAPNSQELIDRVTGEFRTKSDTTLTTVNVDLTGPLFELPGGDLSLAVGGQLRSETAKSDPDHDSNEEAFVFLVGGPDWEADRRIFAGYGELLLPFFEGFELQAAGRLENYDDVGSSLNPMLGVSWTPATTFMGAEAPQASRVRLRGTFSTAFRAPSLLQGDGAITELTEIFNYTADADGQPVRAATGTYNAVRTFGNPNLTPQKSTTITGGLEWSPASGLLLEADYWNYNYADIIVKENAQQKVARDYLNQNDPDITRDAGAPTRINVLFVNAEEVMTHGIDLGVSFRSDFGAQAGTFSAGASGSYVLAYEIPQSAVPTGQWDEEFSGCDEPNLAPTATSAESSSCDVAGSRNINNFSRSLPRLRASIPLGWTLDGHTAAAITNVIGSYVDDFDSDLSAVGEDYRAIDAQVTFDLQYSYRLKETDHLATTFKVGVINLLDSDPPAVNTGYGYDSSTHDPRGRLLYGRLIQEF